MAPQNRLLLALAPPGRWSLISLKTQYTYSKISSDMSTQKLDTSGWPVPDDFGLTGEGLKGSFTAV